MFMTHHAPPNGLDPGDRMPGAGGDPLDEMDSLMSDWSWRDQRPDPGYVYTAFERLMWQFEHEMGLQLPAVRPWSFLAYRGPVARPPRIGVTR
jgi:hypothetical protein